MTAPVVTMDVADCVRSHVSWMTALATLPGGTAWTDGPLHWVFDGPYATVHGLFPDELDTAAAGRALGRARDLGAEHVAVWSAVDVERPELVAAGFEIGWQPWWMGRPTAGADEASVRLARRVTPSRRAREHERPRQPLLDRDDTFRVEARAEGRYAGRAWGHVAHGAAGLYDMGVRAPFRSQGLGTDLVTAALAEAARRGADRMTLNATPEGERLYTACGFTRLGTGRTWWWHRGRER